MPAEVTKYCRDCRFQIPGKRISFWNIFSPKSEPLCDKSKEIVWLGHPVTGVGEKLSVKTCQDARKVCNGNWWEYDCNYDY